MVVIVVLRAFTILLDMFKDGRFTKRRGLLGKSCADAL